MKKGRIISNGVVSKPHELKTVVFLAEAGFDIEFIPRSNIKGKIIIITKQKKLIELNK